MAHGETYVTLVHGTWAGSAQWTSDDSHFLVQLRRKLRGPIVFERFAWDGKNSELSRRVAVEDLCRWVETVQESNPKASQYIIGHSHGGNIAARTLERLKRNEQVRGVVCLSTPFLVAQPRSFGKHADALLHSLILSAVWTPLLTICAVATIWTNSSLVELFLILITFVVSQRSARPLLQKWARHAQQMLEEMQLPFNSADKMLLIRSQGDEASLGLGLAQLLSWSMAKIISAIVLLHELFARLFSSLISSKAVERLNIFGVLTGIMAFPIIIVQTVFCIPVLGWRLAALYPLVDISVEASPPGTATVHLLPTVYDIDVMTSLQSGGHHSTFSLMHCSSYLHPDTPEIIAQWIAAKEQS